MMVFQDQEGIDLTLQNVYFTQPQKASTFPETRDLETEILVTKHSDTQF